jgi:hypothetical protein
VSTAVAVLAVAGIAAYVSYWHAYAVVCAHGETGVTARLEPATIDGLVYASSTVNLYAARHRLPVPGQARAKAGSTWTSPAPSFGLPEEVHPVAGSRTCLLMSAWRTKKHQFRAGSKPTGVPDEDEIDAAAVAAYRSSVKAGEPLSNANSQPCSTALPGAGPVTA